MMTDNEIFSKVFGRLVAFQIALPAVLTHIKNKGFLASDPTKDLYPPKTLKNSTGREVDINSLRFNEGFDEGVSEIRQCLLDLDVIVE